MKIGKGTTISFVTERGVHYNAIDPSRSLQRYRRLRLGSKVGRNRDRAVRGKIPVLPKGIAEEFSGGSDT